MGKRLEQVYEDIEKLIGHRRFPLTCHHDKVTGEVVSIEFETSWKEGGTTPVEDNAGNVIEYKENYKEHSLTDKQVKALREYAKSLGGDE